MYFAEHDAAIRPFQLREDVFDEIGHDVWDVSVRGSPCHRMLRRGSRSIITLSELPQSIVQGRKVVLPGKNSGAQREFGVRAPNGVLEKSPHPRHDLEVSYDGLPDAIAHGFRLEHQRVH